MEALKMESQMDSWNDDRLDELNRRVENGFRSVDQHFLRLEGEMKEGFAKVDGEIKEGFARIDERFDRLLHLLVAVSWGFAGTVFAALVGLLAVLF